MEIISTAKNAVFFIMPNPKIKIKVKSGYLRDRVMKSAVKDIFIEELSNLTDTLKQRSYIGATQAKNTGISLQQGWNFEFSESSLNKFIIRARITNDSPNYVNRVAGREPGKFPPLKPLTDWVEVKLNIYDPKKAKAVAYVIGRKIAREGTNRYKTKKNFAGLNLDGSLQADSIIKETEKAIARRIHRLF
jgi:hypothetical protein